MSAATKSSSRPVGNTPLTSRSPVFGILDDQPCRRVAIDLHDRVGQSVVAEDHDTPVPRGLALDVAGCHHHAAIRRNQPLPGLQFLPVDPGDQPRQSGRLGGVNAHMPFNEQHRHSSALFDFHIERGARRGDQPVARGDNERASLVLGDME